MSNSCTVNVCCSLAKKNDVISTMMHYDVSGDNLVNTFKKSYSSYNKIFLSALTWETLSYYMRKSQMIVIDCIHIKWIIQWTKQERERWILTWDHVTLNILINFLMLQAKENDMGSIWKFKRLGKAWIWRVEAKWVKSQK